MEPPARCPFPHAYMRDETGRLLKCDPECEACEWYRTQYFEQREKLKYPPKAYTPTDADMKFLASVRAAWYGDKR